MPLDYVIPYVNCNDMNWSIEHVIRRAPSPNERRGCLIFELINFEFPKGYYSSQPRALAPRTAALAFIRPETRNLALPWKILSTALL